ncbi:M56 family metallopeptidase [Phocaeicola barnesiae]|uniref:M56 family metallopeptidase n=1 Tax=Phocaeicola barnesiae TaxID=376804 RepID=UPI0025A39974|nr:M56 family metallopeptidase [Phocaeicola barnesiae]MDM8256884.1 TonB family protein [Phocaeicola barnesiae]
MGTFLVYILKSSLCLALFYLFYRLLLSKETFHRFNRIALLGVMLISCLLPLVRVTVDRATVVNTSVMLVEEDMLMYPWEMQTVVQEEAAFPWREWLVAVYLLGIFFFLLRNLWSLVRMLYLIRHSRCRQMENGICLVIHQAGFAPFSWMKYIVISQTDLDENGTDILIHEEAHIRNRHSLDLLLVELCVWLQWFNPAAWLLKQELQNVHEYEADEAVLRQGIDAKRYQMLLIKKAVGARLYSIANSFNHSSLKKRITMMIRKKSNPWARAKYLYVLPLAAVTVAAFARPEISEPLDEISSVKVNDLSAITGNNSPENLSVASNSAADVTLKMKVTDQTGSPIVGASVLIVNSTSGTLTDLEGNFTLKVGDDQRISVSYIGMKSVELSVKECLEKQIKEVRLTSDADSGPQLTVVSQSSESASQKAPQHNTTSEPQNTEEVFMVVENMPEFPGGLNACLKFLADHVAYPKEAAEKKIQGRVIVQFVVMKDGSIANARVIRSVDPLLDAEALRVIGLMPKWKPGTQRGQAVNVKFTMPITFRLDKDSTDMQPALVGKVIEISGATKENNQKAFHFPDGKETPLVVVDGEEISVSSLEKLSSDTFESINVFKGETAINRFGEKGKNGVLLITTKNK